MAKAMNSLLRISMVIHNLGTSSNYSITRRFIQISTNCANEHTKETLVSPRPYLMSDNAQVISNTGSLREAIKNCHLRTKMLSVVQANQSRMTIDDVVFVMGKLVSIESDKPPKNSKLYEEPEFLAMCEIVKKNVRNLRASDLITVLKALIYFHVPTTSIIVEMTLQILRNSVNELSLQHISFLSFLLKMSEKTPLVTALLIALPKVYENNILMKLDRENMVQLRNALSYLSPTSTNTEIFNVILHAINDCKQSIEPEVAQSILWSLCQLQCKPDELPEILHRVQSVLAANITCVDKWVIPKLVQMITHKIRGRQRHFYHEGFFDACASAVISEDWGFDKAIEMLYKLGGIGHAQIPLLDYIAGKCFEDPTLLKTCPLFSITILINGFSLADYKPIFWDAVQDTIMSITVLQAKSIDYQLEKLVLNLLSLDCYCPKLLEFVFQNAIENMPGMGRFRAQRILLIYQAVKTLFPQYVGPLPDNNFFVNVKREMSRETQTSPLINALECALGGRRYVLSNVTSKLGHRIDHALVMRKGGFPVAIDNETETPIDEHPIMAIEDLEPPLDSQVILILCVPPRAYSINAQRMKGIWSMHIRTLETLSGYTVIPISDTMWKSLMDTEKIPYLMRAIKLKYDALSISANS